MACVGLTSLGAALLCSGEAWGLDCPVGSAYWSSDDVLVKRDGKALPACSLTSYDNPVTTILVSCGDIRIDIRFQAEDGSDATASYGTTGARGEIGEVSNFTWLPNGIGLNKTFTATVRGPDSEFQLSAEPIGYPEYKPNCNSGGCSLGSAPAVDAWPVFAALAGVYGASRLRLRRRRQACVLAEP